MIISLIAAVSENNVIGKDNRLVWHLPADLKYFKEKTKGHHVLLGRKTYEALGKPLPNRTHLVITHQKNYKPEGILVFHNIANAIKYAHEHQEDELFVLGGANIYTQMMKIADKMYITRIKEHFEGDTYFPPIPDTEWKIESREPHKKDAKNPYDYEFIEYIKI